jgi:preprotein translocase subunit YajC
MEQLSSILPILAMFAVVYFFMIAPQMKKAKNEKKFASELKRGDRIVTLSGLHAKILELNDKDNSCVIETLSGKLKFDRAAISMERTKVLNKPTELKK